MALRLRDGGVLQRAPVRSARPPLPAPPARSPLAPRGGGRHGIGEMDLVARVGAAQLDGAAAAVELLGQVGPQGGGGERQPTQVPPQQTPTTTQTLSPYRVFFSIAQVSNPACRVPSGSNGAAKVAKYRVVGPTGPASRVTVGEQFTALEDPYSVFGALHPNSYTTDATGAFDDCYSVATRQTLPSDFRLKVEQNHLIGGQVASKQHITFTPGNVFICVFDRRGNAFASHCRRY